jgi:hypothetical protein
MSYFNELKKNKDLPKVSTLENQRKKFNAHFKLTQLNQLEFFASYARFLNLTKDLELKIKSSAKVLQKDVKHYLTSIGQI